MGDGVRGWDERVRGERVGGEGVSSEGVSWRLCHEKVYYLRVCHVTHLILRQTKHFRYNRQIDVVKMFLLLFLLLRSRCRCQ